MVPRFSIIVCFRNATAFLPACLASIHGQTLRDWECLVTDDASEDANAVTEVLAPYAADPRFRIERNPARLGTALNSIRAIRCAEGEIIARVDGDDYLPNEYVLARVAQEYDADETVDGTSGSYIYQPAQRRCPAPAGPWWDYATYAYSALYTWRRAISLRSFEDEPHAYIDPSTGKHYRAIDVALFAPVAFHGRRIVQIPSVTYVYRQHADNVYLTEGIDEVVRDGRYLLDYWKYRVQTEKPALYEASFAS